MRVPCEAAADKPVDSRYPNCLMRSVFAAFQGDPSLKAVTLDKAEQTIEFATLGNADLKELEKRLIGIISRAQAATGSDRCTLLDSTADCLSCVRPISRENFSNITIHRDGPSMTIARVSCVTAPKLYRRQRLPWPKVVQRHVEFLPEEEEIEDWRPQMAMAIACGAFGLLGYFLTAASWSITAYVLAYVAGSWFTVPEVWERLKQRSIDVHLLMLAVALGSASIGSWGEGAMLLFLFSFSSALEHLALGRTQKEIRSLFREAPKVATVLEPDGTERQYPVQRLARGHRLLVKPGAQFPVDAEIAKGQTAADESNLTGEACPVEKQIGDPVLAGTINLWGAVEVVVLRPASESALEKIIRLIKDAQRQKAPAQQFTDKFSSYYTYAVIGMAVVMFFVWWLGFGMAPFAHHDVKPSAFYRTMTLLVVSSPCALVLSIPSAVLAAIAWSARRGILFRGGAAVEKLAGVSVVALDKTGTLTTGDLEVDRIESFPAGHEQEIARWAFSLERLSTHPLARAITRYGKQTNLEACDLQEFQSVTGQGLQARLGSTICRLGRREWLLAEAGQQPAFNASKVASVEPGYSEVWVQAGDLWGRVILRDDIRPQSRNVMRTLRQLGLRTLVLTGDRQAAADYLKTQLDIDEIRAELKPEGKVAAIQTLSREGRLVAMVGDGVNDAPSLAAAHIGVAMGARGADAALEQADVVLMHDRLENFLSAFRLSQRARRIIRQNLTVSLGTVVVLVVFALLGSIPLTVGVVGHEGSTVVVVMNSLRLLFQRNADVEEFAGKG